MEQIYRYMRKKTLKVLLLYVIKFILVILLPLIVRNW